jgi:hypothetical protein
VVRDDVRILNLNFSPGDSLRKNLQLTVEKLIGLKYRKGIDDISNKVLLSFLF